MVAKKALIGNTAPPCCCREFGVFSDNGNTLAVYRNLWTSVPWLYFHESFRIWRFGNNKIHTLVDGMVSFLYFGRIVSFSIRHIRSYGRVLRSSVLFSIALGRMRIFERPMLNAKPPFSGVSSTSPVLGFGALVTRQSLPL